MTTPESGPAFRLAALLETAPPEVRREITAWLLQTREPAGAGTRWPPLPLRERLTDMLHGHGSNLPSTVDSQVVTIRLPTPRHAALRDWCNEHGFSMAAVVRGLVERFLEEQAAEPRT